MTRPFTDNEIAALIAKLEALDGPNFEVENLICETLGLAPDGFERNAQGGWTQYIAARDDVQIWCCPAYTCSLDAAARLIPQGMEWSLSTLYGPAYVEVGLNASADGGPWSGERRDGNIPIAITIAALRARASIRESGRPTDSGDNPPGPTPGSVGRELNGEME